ncbi:MULTISPECIES: TetR/AcrR family transcriptional regulator [Dyella]|uniref:TetR/AcrR family transcriptional regulator n=2 Tax=Dyella TaxID=231454 RepID=A0A4R0YTC9_9GAMM|nr:MULTISPECIES: TetR/AcrR family transcriptional regulator [Dyella]TBR39788.1 TetR/AcrR family transcriptional regulator [Dyella terrae]TCI12633.1 TetR/AcrR family transcriptional regulator [Dyella soli]
MSETVSPGKRAVTRDLILDQAYAMACQDGVEGLSIGTLAAAVGMSKSGVFAHFGSREDLQLAVLESGARRFMAHVLVPALTQPRGIERLRSMIGHWCEWGHKYKRGCVLLSATSEYDGRDGALHDWVVRMQAGWRGELEKAIAFAKAEGHLRGDTDEGQLAFEIYALMLGLHHDAGLFGIEQARKRTDAAVQRLLASYEP